MEHSISELKLSSLKELTSDLQEIVSVIENDQSNPAIDIRSAALNARVSFDNDLLEALHKELSDVLWEKRHFSYLQYLKRYGVSEEQILSSLRRRIEREEFSRIDVWCFDSEDMIGYLDLFWQIGVRNYYGLIMGYPQLFSDTLSSVRRRINAYKDKSQLAEIINSLTEEHTILDEDPLGWR